MRQEQESRSAPAIEVLGKGDTGGSSGTGDGFGQALLGSQQH